MTSIADKIINLQERIQTIDLDIQDLENERQSLEDRLIEVERGLPEVDQGGLASVRRGEAWIERVKTHTGKHPSDLPPSEWAVPLIGHYLNNGDTVREAHSPITLLIRPDGIE